MAGSLHRELAWVGTVPWCVYVKVGAEGGVGVEGGRGKGEGGRGGRGRVARRRKEGGGGVGWGGVGGESYSCRPEAIRREVRSTA